MAAAFITLLYIHLFSLVFKRIAENSLRRMKYDYNPTLDVYFVSTEQMHIYIYLSFGSNQPGRNVPERTIPGTNKPAAAQK